MRSGSLGWFMPLQLQPLYGQIKENAALMMDLRSLYSYLCQLCISVQVVWGRDGVRLLNPPDEALPGLLLDVLFSCDRPATVQLHCLVTFETGAASTALLRQWSCDPGDPGLKTVRLNLPDWLVYRADGIVPDSPWVLSCFLQASVRLRGPAGTQGSITARDGAALQVKPHFSRPFKQYRLCTAWSMHILQIRKEFLQEQCPMEEETVHLLSSVYASTGETFGITKTLSPFNNQLLEHYRVKATSFPWCMFSIWIFVTRHCQDHMCGLFYHIDDGQYVTPAIFLTNSGFLHVQITGKFGESSAFLTPFRVPLSEWCQLSVIMQGRTVSVFMACPGLESFKSIEHTFSHFVVLDDTEGYFVIGGGKYVQGVEGFFGPVLYYRNRILHPNQADVVLPDVIKSLNLTGWLQTCEQFSLEMSVKLSGYSFKAKQRTESSKTSFDVFHEWVRPERPSASDSQCEPWEAATHHRKTADKLVRLLAFKHGGRGASLAAVGRALSSLSLHKLGRASSAGVVSTILPLLLQAGCLADNQALHISSVLLITGLGVQKQPLKAWLLALLAAQRDDRLALLHLGHLHHQGRHGLSSDPDLAYAYYANIAQQTDSDRHNHTSQQAFVEAVFLNNDEALDLQTNEDHHIFQWLKLQASRGAAEAEQSIARMLFWGQQGVSPNIQEAARHYERGAVELQDPVSMYDYGIILLQGLGVEKDIPKAVMFLRKAMDQGFVPAINALAWYYEQYEKDYKQAVRLWEQADLLDSPDAAMNLGVFYSQGLYPGKPPNQFVAYKYYMKSAQRGHMRAAAHLASIWITGIPGLVKRRPSDAVLWAKMAAEQNGYLGSLLRKALDSYLKKDMFVSLLYYIMAAESGYAPAQFNVAYLCEQAMGGFLDPVYSSECMWTFYNFTIQSENPNTYAFIRMGDLYYEGRGRRNKDLFSAAEMYKLAALKGDPQGWYSLGFLVEEGYELPLSIQTQLGLSDLEENDLLLIALYKRCRDSENADSYLPCSLALFNVYLKSFQKDYSDGIKISTAVAVVAAPTLLVVVLGVLRRRVVSLD